MATINVEPGTGDAPELLVFVPIHLVDVEPALNFLPGAAFANVWLPGPFLSLEPRKIEADGARPALVDFLDKLLPGLFDFRVVCL